MSPKTFFLIFLSLFFFSFGLSQTSTVLAINLTIEDLRPENATITEDNVFKHRGFNITLEEAESRWVRDGDMFYPEIKNESYYEFVEVEEEEIENQEMLIPLSEVTFNTDFLKLEGEFNGTYGSWELDFSDFYAKNNITNKTITENYPSLLECIWDENIIFVSEIRDCLTEIQSYDITFTGEIVDLDPTITFSPLNINLLHQGTATTGNHVSHLNITNKSLTVYMSFDETNLSDLAHAENVFTRSGNAYHNVTGGIIGGGYDLDGSGDWLSQETLWDAGGRASISIWFYSDATATQSVFGKSNVNGQDRFTIYTVADGRLLTWGEEHNNGVFASWARTNVAEGWHHLVVTWDTTNLTVYMNGVLDVSNATGGTMASGSHSDFFIGNNWGTDSLQGGVDEFMFFNDVILNGSEVLDIFNNQSSRFTSPGNVTSQFAAITPGAGETHVEINITAGTPSAGGDLTTLAGTVYTTNLSLNGTASNHGWIGNATGINTYGHFDWGYEDESGNGHDFAAYSSPALTDDGYFGGSIYLTGGINFFYAHVDNVDFTDTNHTLALWIKDDNTVDAVGFIMYQRDYYTDGYQIYYNTNDGTVAAWRDEPDGGCATVAGGGDINDGNWHHFAMTFEANLSGAEARMAVYQDGVLVGEDISGCGTAIPDGSLIFGDGQPGNGRIRAWYDEVMIWDDKALTNKEIKSLYLTGSINHQLNYEGINWTRSPDGFATLADNNLDGNYTGVVEMYHGTTTTHILQEAELSADTDNFITPYVVMSSINSKSFAGPEEIVPYFTDGTPYNMSLLDSEPVVQDINWTDETGLDTIIINDTVNFEITSTAGVLTNKTVLTAGTYAINVTINDTTNNQNSSIFWIEVTSANTAPSITSIILNSTNNLLNDTSQNLTGYISYNDTQGDNTTLIYNWYKDNVLNATSVFIDDPALVAYIPFNSDRLDYKGDSGTAENGNPVLNTTDGIINNSYTFDGNNDYVNITNMGVTGNNNFTIVAWFNVDSLDTTQRIFSYGGSAVADKVLYIGPRHSEVSKFSFGDYGAAETWGTTPVIAADTWYQIVWVHRDENTNIIYLNGSEEFNSNGLGAFDLDGDTLQIGAAIHNPGNEDFQGEIDEVMFFNRTLTPTEVQQLYQGSAYGGDTMHSSQTTTGDYWKLGAVAGDSELWSSEVNSSEIYIRDAEGPTVTITNPLEGSEQDLVFLFNFTAIDDLAVDQSWYAWKGTNTTYTTPLDLYSSAGSQTITAWANDTSGNLMFDTNTFTTRDFDTNATTECGPGELLDGDGNCVSTTALNQTNQTGSGTTTTTSIKTCRYKKFGYYNENLPFYKEVNCI